MALLALILTIAGTSVSAVAVWTGLNASKVMPWDLQTWKGQSPEEQAFSKDKRRDAALTLRFGILGTVGVVIGALLAYYSR